MSKLYCSLCGREHATTDLHRCRLNLSEAVGQETHMALDYQKQRDELRATLARIREFASDLDHTERARLARIMDELDAHR